MIATLDASGFVTGFAAGNGEFPVVTVGSSDAVYEYRGKTVSVGWRYNQEFDLFMRPQPFASWTFNGNDWVAPIPAPQDGRLYQWNEQAMKWEIA